MSTTSYSHDHDRMWRCAPEYEDRILELMRATYWPDDYYEHMAYQLCGRSVRDMTDRQARRYIRMLEYRGATGY